MRQSAAGSRFFSCLNRFARERDGISAIEFALILPFMLTLYLGGSELSEGMAIQFKATLAARTVADLASQCGNANLDGQYCDTANGLPIDSTSMSQILGAASTVMTPYPANNMTITVSELRFKGGNGAATVVWSASNSGSGRTLPYTLPPKFQQLPPLPGDEYYYVILGEVKYPYTPSLGYAITGTINISENAIFFPRNSNLPGCVQYNYNGQNLCL